MQPDQPAEAGSKSTGIQDLRDGKTPDQNQVGTTVVKISVLSNGELLADGEKVTIDQLAPRLAKVKKANGHVLYYREDAGGEPPATGMQVIKLVIDNQLPVSLSTKADFSDCVDDKGQAHQR
jgi:hypothetical protein